MNLNTKFEMLLRGYVEEEVRRQKDILANGLAVPDYPAYMKLVGIVQGLDMIDGLCDQVNKEINEQ